MNRFFKICSLAFLSAALWSACEATELEDLLVDPNLPSPDEGSIEFVFNAVQLSFEDFLAGATEGPGDNFPEGVGVFDRLNPYVRYVNMGSGNVYDNQDQPVNFNFIWQRAYANIIPDVKVVKSQARELNNRTVLGIAQVYEAFTYLTLVDVFGDVPFSETGQGIDIQNPKLDGGDVIYQAMLDTLDQAIANLSAPPVALVNDIYYGGGTTTAAATLQAAKWTKVAKTLQLKAHLNLRLVSPGESRTAIAALITGDQLISTKADDLAFPYSSTRSGNNSRSVWFSDNYETGASDYMANSFMFDLLTDYSVVDPRLRYYIYRQDLDATNEDFFTLDCQQQPRPNHYGPSQPFCTANPRIGYWGRDHGNASGIPPDDLKRSIYGLYPAGGRFDDNSALGVADDNGAAGARGAGHLPILMHHYVKFMRAEAALFLQTEANPKQLLLDGIKASFQSVHAYSVDFAGAGAIPAASSITGEQKDEVETYLEDVAELYDAAGTDELRMQVIGREYYKAAWLNGLEAYNLYRRTGKPNDLQPVLDPGTGTFPRTMIYPNDAVTLNSSISQKPLSTRVFWDNNAPGFIN